MKKTILFIILLIIIILVVVAVGISDKNSKRNQVAEFNFQFDKYKRKDIIWSRCTHNNK